MWGNPRSQFRQSWRFEKINADTPVWIDGRRLDKCLSGYFFWYSLTVHLLMVDWCCFIIRNSLEALNFYVVDARFKVSMCHRPIHRYKPLLMYAASPMPSVVGMRNKWRLIVTVNSLLISIEEIWRLLWRRSSQHRRQGFAGHPNVCRSVWRTLTAVHVRNMKQPHICITHARAQLIFIIYNSGAACSSNDLKKTNGPMLSTSSGSTSLEPAVQGIRYLFPPVHVSTAGSDSRRN